MATRPPNVLLVLTDDQGYPPIGANGHPFVQTPHLDRFAAEAVRFEQFHSGTTCAPTRAGLLTGHYCNSTGVWHTVGGRSLLRADEWTLADALGEAGWRTGIFGKWHLGDAYPYRPQDRGFQRSIVHGGGGIGQTPDRWGNDYFDDTYLVDGVPTPFQGYCTDVFFEEALRFIEARPRAPFFCLVSTNAPHSPFNVPPEFQALYAGKTATETYARFLGMISNIDQNFGVLRARLAAAGLEQDTLLMFASDNGQCPLAVQGELIAARPLDLHLPVAGARLAPPYLALVPHPVPVVVAQVVACKQGSRRALGAGRPKPDTACAPASRARTSAFGGTLAIETACVEIGGLSQVVAVSDGDGERAARLAIMLEAGETQLRAWFGGAAGLMQSPYYVEVQLSD